MILKISKSSPTCIDSILTYATHCFQSNCVLETRLYDFHLVTLTIMRKIIKRFEPRIKYYRPYKLFSNDLFRKCLFDKLSEHAIVNNDNDLQNFIIAL